MSSRIAPPALNYIDGRPMDVVPRNEDCTASGASGLKLRIAIVTHKVQMQDGQGRVNYEIALAALRQGHSVTIVGESCAYEIAHHPRGRFVCMRKIPIPTQMLRNLYFAAKSTLWLYLHRAQFDLVQANGWVTWARADVVAVHFVHTTWMNSRYFPFRWSSMSPYSWYQCLITRMNAYFERITFAQARRLVAVSSPTAAEVVTVGIPADRITVVYNGIDMSEFQPGTSRRDSFGLPLDVPLALFAGDIRTPRKNLDSVLHALTEIPELHLAVAGKTQGSPYLALARELRISDRVHFLGMTSRMNDLMRSVDFFVFPSRYEAHPLVLMEAMASGLPVVVSDNFGAGDYVQGGGIVFGKPDDVAALAAAMRELVHSAEERKRMGEAARRAASEMDWATTADGYLKVYADLNESQDRDSKSARS